MFKVYLKDLLIQIAIYAIEKLVEVVKSYGTTDDKVTVKKLTNR